MSSLMAARRAARRPRPSAISAASRGRAEQDGREVVDLAHGEAQQIGRARDLRVAQHAQARTQQPQRVAVRRDDARRAGPDPHVGAERLRRNPQADVAARSRNGHHAGLGVVRDQRLAGPDRELAAALPETRAPSRLMSIMMSSLVTCSGRRREMRPAAVAQITPRPGGGGPFPDIGSMSCRTGWRRTRSRGSRIDPRIFKHCHKRHQSEALRHFRLVAVARCSSHPSRITGAAMLSIITLMQAGLRLARARSIAAGKVGGALDQLAMAAERRDHQVVARRRQRRSRAWRSLPYSRSWIWLSAFQQRVVAEDRDERQVAPHRGLEFGEMEADRAVAEHGEDRRLRLLQPRGDRERQRAADRAGDAVDHAPPHRQHALAPIGRTRRRRRSAPCRDRARHKGAARETLPRRAGGPASAP